MGELSLIGPHVLSESMMDCGFHYREDVLKNIEYIRANAAQDSGYFNRMLQEYEQEAVMLARGHNNTISILGSRGSGKTSIILTLHRILHNGNNSTEQRHPTSSTCNIMMPLLVPQDITPDQSLLSWIVSQLLKKAEEIEAALQSDSYNGLSTSIWREWCRPQHMEIPCDPFRECMDALLIAFDLRSQSGRREHLLQPMEADHVYYYMNSVKRDADLLTNMLRLISMIIDYYRYLTKNGAGGQNREPLLFFTIDDLDLAPERSSEVLNLILRYLQHPNVVIICGWNHELFQNHLSMDLLRTQGVLKTNQLDSNFSFEDVFMERYRKRTTARDSARRLAIDNLKKAFPPAQRYEIRSLSIQERASFPYALTPGKADKDITKKRLFALIEQTIQRCTHDTDLYEKKVPFLHNSQGAELAVYTRIFDNKARGLTNVYRAFESLLDSQEKLEGELLTRTAGQQYEDITNQIKVLFDVILFSNTRFAPYRRGLRDLVQIKNVTVAKDRGSSRLEYYCNFRAAKDIFKKYEEEKQQTVEYGGYDDIYKFEEKYDYFPNLIIDVFLLLNFMENFLHYITRIRGGPHGGWEFSAALNELRKPIDFKARNQDLLTQAIRSSGTQKLRLFPDTDDFALNIAILNAYENGGFEENQYHLTGFHSLIQIFRMVHRLLAVSDQDALLDKQKILSVLKADPEWLTSIITLFAALRPTRENVTRLAVYSNVLESTHGNMTAALQAAARKYSLYARLKNQRPEVENLTDENLDILVECLRTLDKHRGNFTRCKRRGTLGKRTSQDDRKAILLAQTYLRIEEELGCYCLEDLDDLKVVIEFPAHYRDQLLPLKEFKDNDSRDTQVIKGDMSTIQDALRRADHEINILLHDLKARMWWLLIVNYTSRRRANPSRNSIDNLEKRYQYLDQAAIALWQYQTRWEVQQGDGWGKKESRAANELMAIFQKHFCENQVDDMLEIIELGPLLEKEGRSRFSNLIENIKNWVNTHSEDFEEDEQERIRSNLTILSDALKHIRRGLPVEDEIHKTIMEIGQLVAEEFAVVSYKMFNEWKDNSEKRLLIWPVNISYDTEMEQLYEMFKTLIPEKTPLRKSLLDVSYSDIELYLQIAKGQLGEGT